MEQVSATRSEQTAGKKDAREDAGAGMSELSTLGSGHRAAATRRRNP
jgi:hypothetical protein